MSIRPELLEMFLQSEETGEQKRIEQMLMTLMGEQALTQLISIAINGFALHGAGSLFINLIELDPVTFQPSNDAVYMNGNDLEQDIREAERYEDDDVVKLLRQILEQVDENDWTTHVVFTYLTPNGTRTYSVEAGGSQESFRAIAGEFSG